MLSEDTVPGLPQIYDAYHSKVLAYAAKLLGRAEAEDVSQEVFLRIGRSLGSLADPAKLGSWIFAITLNAVRDVARKHGRTEAAGDEAVSHLADTGSRTPEESAIRHEMIACYLDYVKQLPPNYYEVYVLSELEQLSNQEIARRLSLSSGTVKVRLHRARAQLNEELRRNCRCYTNQRGELMGEPKGREGGV